MPENREKEEFKIGGQAVIEGVMMRSRNNYTIAVRRQDGIIQLVNEKIKNLSPGEYATLALYTRYLKRTSAHLTNIASSIVNPFHRIGFKPK